MNTRDTYIGFGVLWALTWAAAGCSPSEGSAAEQDEASSHAEPAVVRIVNVEVETVRPSNFTDFIRITGETEAFSDVTVAAEETGLITDIFFEKGQRVRRGQVIAQIDTAVIAAQVRDARAAAALAREHHLRQKQLWEEESIGSEIAYLEAKYGADRAEAQLKVLEARLAKTSLRAPVSGSVDDRFLEVGEMAVVGAPVVRIVSTDRVKIIGGIPERFASSVEPNDIAKITFDILPNREFEGTIRFVGSTVNEANRTFPIEIWMDNPEGVVKAHMVANVQVVRSDLSDVIVVSQNSVVRTEEGYQVFIVEQDGDTPLARAREVRLGATYSGRVVIQEGLEVGERLIKLGQQIVDDGTAIRVVNQDTER